MSKVPLLHGFCQKTENRLPSPHGTAARAVPVVRLQGMRELKLPIDKCGYLVTSSMDMEDRIRTHLEGIDKGTNGFLENVTNSAPHAEPRWRISHEAIYLAPIRRRTRKCSKVEKIIKGYTNKPFGLRVTGVHADRILLQPTYLS